MVEMMRGVTEGGGTAAGASAGGNPVAGKTGTVNSHTDVWFIGYTPTYVTGVWMGNPERKENLGSGMTGGHGALPFFNAFMNPFMKGKPIEKFPEPPPMPSDIKALMERNKREELEKLESATIAGARSTSTSSNTAVDPAIATGTGAASADTGGDSDASKPKVDDAPPPVVKPIIPKPQLKDPEPQRGNDPEGTKRKGKKGDG
jgi:penicillin-binding protein 1A